MVPLHGVCDAPSGTAHPPLVNAPSNDAPDASVVVFNRTVLSFRVPYLGMSTQERARRSMVNIQQALDLGGPGVVSVKATPQGQLIFVDELMTVILSPDDVDPLAGDTLDKLTARTVLALQQSIKATQEARDTHHLLISMALVAGATVLAVVLYAAAGFVRKRLLSALLQFVERKTAALGAGATEILRRGRIVSAIRAVDLSLRWALGLLVAYAWVSFSLQRFPYTRPWGEGLHAYLVSVASKLAMGIIGAVPGLLVAVLILLIARAVVGALGSFFERVEQGHVGVHWMAQESAGPTRRIATWLIWLFALAMAYPYLPGAQTEAFKGMSVLIGLMMSMGASSFVGQVAGGMILTYSSMLRKGEYVRIGEHEGTVVSIGAFNTRIRTGLGEEITLPNSLIVGSATKNYSRAVKGAGYVVDTVVTIGYDTPWRQVHAMLIEAAHRTPGVLADPAPTVFQTALSDYYPEYRLVCQAIPQEPRPRAEVLATLHANIQDVFNEYGVQIMSPHYVLDPGEAKVVPPARWYAEPARHVAGSDIVSGA
ncbi:MAG: mechanosensitive ion channel family protein [Aquabacterium sp.]|nr:MAG: mechanosensitive ion channel family protein [Aquabacterium sp.]